MNTRQRYRDFAAQEAGGHSTTYVELAEGIAADPELPALIDLLPQPKRQPNLLLASVRFLGGPVTGYSAFRTWTIGHWPRVRATILERRTQTNEPGRCASLLPVLAGLPQPLALIEVGASAGLCLYPDRYRYVYDGRTRIGSDTSPVTLTCETRGEVPLPAVPPEVVWRAGIDLHPLDVRDREDVRWLECLIWPGQTRRLRTLQGAVEVAAAEPPLLIRGDLNEAVRELLARAPAGATPVVFHSAVLNYLSAPEREAFAETVRGEHAHWISNEAVGALPSVQQRLHHPVPQDRLMFVLAMDEEPLALTGPHGQRLEWLNGP
ncbi:DUF2332 domain-containing protein [Streptomyces sp. F63]|uniref:DUF2332 domain-containing protein n=1 Tax=Streptomyces sp. F63 TaxID=2824887 RepID=UPI001B37FD6F|nr:DUF2332 domain-containing protein [Streptomyces sp. F63]MBQ0983977.1 DUF2332 domain-containing protein [Streptomyces sp. F63]